MIEEPKPIWPWQNKLDIIYDDFQEFTRLLERYYDRVSLIRKIDKAILEETSSPEKVYEIILNEGAKQIGADFCQVISFTRDETFIIASSNPEDVGKRFSRNVGIVGLSLKRNEMITAENCEEEKSYFPINKGVVSEIAIPVKDKTNLKTLGVLNFEWKTYKKFDEEVINHVQLLTGQLALAIEQAKLWNCINLINQFNVGLLSGAPVSKVYQDVLDGILDNLGFEYGQISQYNKELRQLRIVADKSPAGYINSVLLVDNSISGHYLIEQRGSEPLYIPDLENSSYKEKYWETAFGKEMPGSMLLVPLITRIKEKNDNKVVGLINIESSDKNAFNEIDIRIIQIIGGLIAESIHAGMILLEKSQKERSEQQGLILTQMGSTALQHLHTIGGTISGLVSDLRDLQTAIAEAGIKLPMVGQTDGMAFLEEAIQDGIKMREQISSFKNDFNPDRIGKEKKQINIYHEIERLVASYSDKKRNRIRIKPSIKELVNEGVDLTEQEGRLLNIVKDNLICDISPQFKEILEALINNGLEAMSEDTGILTIRVGYSKKDLLDAQIVIEDQGEGIEKQILDEKKIFEYGFTTKKSGKAGQGLGMWFVKYFIDYFGGEITVESEKDKGTKITLRLPLII